MTKERYAHYMITGIFSTVSVFPPRDLGHDGEVRDYLTLLFDHFGRQQEVSDGVRHIHIHRGCPACGADITADMLADDANDAGYELHIDHDADCPRFAGLKAA